MLLQMEVIRIRVVKCCHSARSRRRRTLPNLEIRFWYAISLANAGRLEAALPVLEEVFTADRNWLAFAERLMPIGLLDLSEDAMMSIRSCIRQDRGG